MSKVVKALSVLLITAILSFAVLPLTSTVAALSDGLDVLYADKYDRKIDAIIATMPSNLSDLEKVVYIHDYIVSSAEYDVDADQIGNNDSIFFRGYDILLFGKGVCDAYAEAFYDIMQRLNIECYRATSENANHAWNIVNVDGNFYHVDCTFDDPKLNLKGKAYHNYLLVSTERLYELEQENYRVDLEQSPESARYNDRSDWILTEKTDATNRFYESEYTVSCNDTSYDYCSWVVDYNDEEFFKKDHAFSNLVRVGNLWYFVSEKYEYIEFVDETTGEEYAGYSFASVQLMATEDATDFSNATVVYDFVEDENMIWWDLDGGGSIWLACYGLIAVGDNIYGNSSDGCWQYNITTGECIQNMLLEDSTTANIYGCTYSEGYFVFDVRTSPNSNPLSEIKIFAPLLIAEIRAVSPQSVTEGAYATVLVVAKKSVFEDEGDELLDVDCDGEITILDLIRIKKCILNETA